MCTEYRTKQINSGNAQKMHCHLILLTDYLYLLRCAVRVKQRQVFEICDIVSVGSFAFGQNGKLACEFSAYSLDQLNESSYRLACADDIINYKYALAAKLVAFILASCI